MYLTGRERIISHTQMPARGPNRLLTEDDFDRLPHEGLVHLDSRILANIDREVHNVQTLLRRPGPRIGPIFVRREVPACKNEVLSRSGSAPAPRARSFSRSTYMIVLRLSESRKGKLPLLG